MIAPTSSIVYRDAHLTNCIRSSHQSLLFANDVVGLLLVTVAIKLVDCVGVNGACELRMLQIRARLTPQRFDLIAARLISVRRLTVITGWDLSQVGH